MLNPAHRFAVIVLAAGLSTRLPGEPKLLKPWRGRPLMAHSLDTVLGVSPAQIITVVNETTASMCDTLDGTSVERVPIDDPSQGMGASLAAGIRALRSDIDAVFIALADMPCISADTYARLSRTFNPGAGITIVRPRFNGQWGHPVLFGRIHFGELSKLSGDTGARSILDKHTARMVVQDVDDPGSLIDFDCEADFQNQPGRESGGRVEEPEGRYLP
ncbi:hypothetical protein GCM10007392_25960 [Saccharospirillum salsuginis]|uniref:MobA-like NTP transferase domain-containing protein n=2 Tax=Saccharospirillum salsuginis TaxID=418750 RepID=A0A918KC87_9GAMM|nr:hypothetical protein GCM10007392_25960 [Saccharospirillum salsuginis]